MKKAKKIFTTLCIALLISTCFVPTSVFAAGVFVREGNIDTFMQNIPSVTSVAKQETVTAAMKKGNYEFESNNPNLVWDTTNKRLVCKGTYTAGIYEFGDCSIIVKDCVLLSDGTMADLKIHYDNIRASITGLGEANEVYLTSGDNPLGLVARYDTFVSGTVIGIAMIAEMSVVKDGQPVDATILVSTVDLDQKGVSNVGSAARPVRGYDPNIYQYIESMGVISGAMSDIHMPDTSFLQVKENIAYGTRVDNDTYNAGFAVQADTNGFAVSWSCVNGGSIVYLDGQNFLHVVEAETFGNYAEGGKIKTSTTAGTPVEVSTENSNNTHKSALGVPDGRDVTCVIEVKDGYVLDEVYVDGLLVDHADLVDNGDGTYTYLFPNNDADHKIEASFRKNPSVTYKTDGNGDITGNDNEVVEVGGNPIGTTQSPNEGYEFKHWIADKDVTFEDGTVIQAGEPITEDEITQIIVIENLELTAVYTEIITQDEPTPDKPTPDKHLINGHSHNESKKLDITNKGAVKTGDDSNLFAMMMLMLLAGAGGVVAYNPRKRKNKDVMQR